MPSLNYQARFALPVYLGLKPEERHVKGSERDTEPYATGTVVVLNPAIKPKRQTIRGRGVWKWVPGDKAVMMCGGYNASRRKIGTVRIAEVYDIEMYEDSVQLYQGGEEVSTLTGAALEAFAGDDGFTCYADMVAWFKREYGVTGAQIVFGGMLLKW